MATIHAWEEGTHEYMKGVFICRTHHEQGGAIAVCAECTRCRTWVVLIGRSMNAKWIGLPNQVIDRGYFREGEIE
jgi:hypothetical protein